MRRMASPAALSRTLSLQRANARAKSSRAESFSDQPSQLSRRVEILLTTTSSCNNVSDGRNIMDTQTIPAVNEPPSKQFALQVDDGISTHNAMKRSLSADIPSAYKACFSSLSERIHRGVDLWDREFSSMSSYASEHDGFLCGLMQTRLNSDSSIVFDPVKGKEDACSKSSWSEESLNLDAIQMQDAPAYSLQGLGIDCASGSRTADKNSQCNVRRTGLQACDKRNPLLPEECSADDAGAKIVDKARIAGTLDEYLMRRCEYVRQCLQGGDGCTHSLQDAAARDGDAETMEEGHLTANDGSSNKSQEDAEGEVIMSRKKNDDDIGLYRMRVRSKRDYDRLEEEIMMSNEGENDMAESKREKIKGRCRKKLGTVREGGGQEMTLKSHVEKRGGGALIGGVPPDSVAVELMSMNVVQDFRESMYEMMMEKNMEEECEDSSMQALLNCYLLLNPSHLHGIIREVFSDVWIDIIMTIR